MQQTKKTRGSDSNRKLNEILRRLDVLIVIQLAKSDLTLKEIAKVLGISEDTIERMLPFRKLKAKKQDDRDKLPFPFRNLFHDVLSSFARLDSFDFLIKLTSAS